MVRYADMEMTVIRKDVFSHSSLETGDSAGPHEEAAGSVVRQTEQGKPWAKAFVCLLWEGDGEAGQASLALTGLDHFSEVWGLGFVPSCPGVIRAMD